MKTPIREMSIAVNTVDFERLLAAAIECENVKKTLKHAEAKIVKMRAELTRYQMHCERAKISGSGETGKPQETKTNADENTCAVLATNETEGRVSGGNRAFCEDVKNLVTEILESEANNDGRA